MESTQMFKVIFLTLAFSITYTAADLTEVCQWETFQAKCQEDEVILMKEAYYGRMRVGRCQPRDYFVGCSADVTSVMHARCSGRQNCSIPVPDPVMFAASPCNKDLVSYLEADYECVKVTKSNPENCRDQILTGPSGYLSKPQATNMKNPCPQHILAQPGQTVNIYLYDFSNQHNDIEAKFYKPECISYGSVSEENVTPTNICGGEIKMNQLIYSSNKYIVEVSLASDHAYNYLLHYQVVGCPTLQTAENSQLKIEDDTATITCDYSTTVVTLVCTDNQWVGDQKNCTAPNQPIAGTMSVKSFSDIFANSSTVVVCIALALGLLCSVAFLALTITYLNRQHSKNQQVMDSLPTSFPEKPIDFINEPCIDASIQPVDQYQSVYIPIKLNTHVNHSPVNQSQPHALTTFQSRVNIPIIGDYATTLENRIPVHENNYAHVRPIRDCGHTIYDLAALRKTMGQEKIITIDNASPV